MCNKTFKQRRAFLVNEFTQCKPVLSAVGDETRQLIIKTLLEHCGERGLRVGEIQKNTNISRTAVSHHLKILKEANIIIVRKQGTMNFYSFNATSSSILELLNFWREAKSMLLLCATYQKETDNYESELTSL